MNRLFIRLFYPCMRDTPLNGVQSGDSCGISGTGETPQEHGFSDEEAHHPPHGKRPLGTQINSFSVILFKKTFSVASLSMPVFLVFLIQSEVSVGHFFYLDMNNGAHFLNTYTDIYQISFLMVW